MKIRRRIDYFLILIILLFSVFIFKLSMLHPVLSDETIYINMGKEVLKGKLPYRDFFFAHPPLQLFWIAFLFKIFGLNFFIPKIFCLIISFSSLLILYLIGKELYNAKVAFLSTLFMLFWPGFLIFCDHAYGMWEIFFIFLLSMYLVLTDREEVGAILFSVGVFFRYLILLYFPFLIILSHLKKKKTKKFFIFTAFSTLVIFIIIYSIFGFAFIDNSILFQLSTKIFEGKIAKLIFQYLDLGYFSLFLAFISFFYSFLNKEKFLLFFSLYPIVTDLLLFFSLKTIAYHYFILSLPLVMLAASKVFLDSGETFLKIFIVIIFFTSIYHNLPSFEFYFDYSNLKYIDEIVELVKIETDVGDSIFGEPVLMNYVSFVSGRRISAGLLDSDPRHLYYEKEEKILEKIKDDPPKIFIYIDNLYSFLPQLESYFLRYYKVLRRFCGAVNYVVYIRE